MMHRIVLALSLTVYWVCVPAVAAVLPATFREHLAGSLIERSLDASPYDSSGVPTGRAHLSLRFTCSREDVPCGVASGSFRLQGCPPDLRACPGTRGTITDAGEGGPADFMSKAFVFHSVLDSGNVCEFRGRFPFISAALAGNKAGIKYYPDLSGTFVCRNGSGATVYEGVLLLCPGC